MNTSLNTASSQVVNDMGSIRNLRNEAQKDQNKALKEAAKSFEALFLQMMLKEARATKWSEGFAEGTVGNAGAMDSYKEWRDDQLAQDLSTKGSMGIADMLLKQLTPKYPKANASTDAMSFGTEFAGDQTAQLSSMKRQYFEPVSAPLSNMTMARPLSDIGALDRVSGDTGVGMPTAADTVMLRNLLLGRKE